MTLEPAQRQSLFKTLNLGSFPRNVLDLKDSDIHIHQIVYADYQLQLTLPLVSAQTLFETKPGDKFQVIIKDLILHVDSLKAEILLSQLSYVEVYYVSVVLAHLQVLAHDFKSAIATLKSFKIEHSVVFESYDEREFLDYMSSRFHALLSKASQNGIAVRSVFLKSFRRCGHTSQVAANMWIDSIIEGLVSELSENERRPVHFNELRGLDFAENICSFVAVANHSLGQKYEKLISPSFKNEYVNFLTDILNDKIKERKEFPNASDEKSEELDFVETFYQTLSNACGEGSDTTQFLKAKLSKKFLISMSEKSYQSQSVLLNMIKALIDLGEYDEAYAAFKTYVSYVKKEKTQTGSVADLLQVISLYSLCIMLFNPLNSFIPDAKSARKRFKYTPLDTITLELIDSAKNLIFFMSRLADHAGLSYGNTPEDFNDPLIFLYHKFNPSMLLDNNSALVTVLSDSWFSLGKLYHYLSTYNSANVEILNENKKLLLSYYKNSLIMDPCGNMKYMFDYALVLAYENYTVESAKLCKFILRKLPESFKTWNLLALSTSALETRHSIYDRDPSESVMEDKVDIHVDAFAQGDRKEKVDKAEKFIDDALNIAIMSIRRHRESGTDLSLQTKYEILQLKMTQLAIWEAKSGVEIVTGSISDIFVLYRDLFLGVSVSRKDVQNTLGARSDAKWSRRPSVMDPNESTRNTNKHLRHLSKDSIKIFSKSSSDTREKKTTAKLASEISPSSQHTREMRILQDLWLWTASVYLRLGSLEEAEQCIIEAETADNPNIKTHTYLGFLTSQHRKHLALQEFERSFEGLHSAEETFNKKSYCLTLLGMSHLLVAKELGEDSLFVSEKDRDAGLVRIKNYLEDFSNCWPYGHYNSEVWFYLSSIYEIFDDKILQAESLWKCVDLESTRPVRSYDVCEEFAL